MTTGGKAVMTAKDDDHGHGRELSSPKDLPEDKLWHSSNRKKIIVMAGNRSIV